MRKPTYYRDWDEAPAQMDLGDAAIMLQRNPETVRKLFQTGEINAKKIGGSWSVNKEVLRRWALNE